MLLRLTHDVTRRGRGFRKAAAGVNLAHVHHCTVSKLKVYDKKNCTMVFMINISSQMYGEMILGVVEIYCRGISKKFNIKVHKLQDTFLGTWTRATCVLKMSRGSP